MNQSQSTFSFMYAVSKEEQHKMAVAVERMRKRMRELGYSKEQIEKADRNHFNDMLDYIDRHGSKYDPVTPVDMISGAHADGRLQQHVGEPQNT